MWGFVALKLQTIFAASESCVAFYITEGRMKFMQRRLKNTKKYIQRDCTCDRNWGQKELSSLNVLFLQEAAQDEIGFTTIIDERPEFVCDSRLKLPRAKLRPGFKLFLWTFRRTIVAKIVFLNVSYLHTFVPFMYFYNFTVKKIMAKMYVFYIKYLLIQNGKVRDICFDFLHWNNRPVIEVQLYHKLLQPCFIV